MLRHLLASGSLVALSAVVGQIPVVYANANAGSKLFISPVAVTVPRTQVQLEAIADWVEIKGVGSHGEAGTSTNILTYDTWDTDVAQKAKGISDAGSPEIELARMPSDPGQDALRTAAKTNLNYAFKMERNDKVTVGGDPTVIYNVGIVTGPKRPFGRNEDFDLEVFTLGLNQLEIVVDPS